MEVPQYTLRPNINRMVAPWIFRLLGLAILFYGGVYLNAKFALKMQIPIYINALIAVFLLVLIIAQIIIYKVKFGKYKYEFYTNRVDHEGKDSKTFLYGNFQEMTLKQNILDKMFNTGSIRLSKEFSIGPVANVTQIKSYLEQLIKYYQYSQQQNRMMQQQAATGTGYQQPAQQAAYGPQQQQARQTTYNRQQPTQTGGQQTPQYPQ